MDFYGYMQQIKKTDILGQLEEFTSADVQRVIDKVRLDENDFLCLLSQAASFHLKELASKANLVTLKNFGQVILLYTPIYLADYCDNECVYCSFSVKNKFSRKKLTLEQLEEIARDISKTGLKHILILTGESRNHSPVEYIKECIVLLRKYFTSVSIEVYPLETQEYRLLVDAGLDGVTIYQEVYNEKMYDSLHKTGPKKNFSFRLDAPERAAKAGVRSLNVGALLGLDNFRLETFFAGLHAQYLQKKYWDIEVGMSLPRFRPHLGNFVPDAIVSDKEFVQALMAIRIFLPRSGISISTREEPEFRENILPLGITRMSAGVSTNVGGQSMHGDTKPQFDISDLRSVSQIRDMLEQKGYQAAFVDWR